MNEAQVSAQVILRSASGRRVDGNVQITAANVADFAPAPEHVAAAQETLSQSGFEVGAMIGISFSITAPARLFEHVFGVALQVDGANVRRKDTEALDGSELELPLHSLPSELRALISTVAFSPPAELFEGGAFF